MYVGFYAIAVMALGTFFYCIRVGKIEGFPEPPGNYILGHIFLLRGNFCKTFLRWKETVGPVFQLRFFRTRVVVFNDRESIAKICSMREASGRVRMGFFKLWSEIMGEGVVASEGQVWAEQRQLMVRSFRKFGVQNNDTARTLQDEIFCMLEQWEGLEGSPFILQGCNTNFVFNALWSVIGRTRINHSEISKLSHHMHVMTSVEEFGQKLAYLSVYVAGKLSNAIDDKIRGFQALADFAHKSVVEHQKDRIPNRPRDVIDQILDQMEASDDVNSAYNEKNLQVGFALGEIIAATIDTTSRTLEWFMFYLAWCPSVASKLHNEIDKVFCDGSTSLPKIDDRDHMPYTQACILEALRIGSVVPFGVPHKALEEFTFKGAVIPKGAILIMNLYGVHHDPNVWNQPHEFKPERFLTPEGDQIDVNVTKEIVAFGTGRRKCAGYVLAMDFMFLYVVNAYRKFRFEIVGHADTCEGRFGIIFYPPSNVQLKAVICDKN